jgi:D-serine deaminase-like pyridoxal phosphate-dependent protein
VTSIHDIPTPALLLDAALLEANIAAMSELLPGSRLRPHVKAHKCTAIARRQLAQGHRGFTCATLRELEGMAAAGLGHDLLLANEVVDVERIRHIASRDDARITFAVDSSETIAAAAAGGVREVLIDVNVGLPRCGCAPGDAGSLADQARTSGMQVRGVMGYEGHVVGLEDAAERRTRCEESMQLLLAAHAEVGGDLISAGGTGTFDSNTWATEIQAGSYVLMDTAYGRLGLPFVQAFWVWSTVVSVSEKYVVADCGLKSLGMDHGNPEIADAKVWFCSDEHITYAPSRPVSVGDRVRIAPSHVDPTMAYHQQIHVIAGENVEDTWDIDLRGW